MEIRINVRQVGRRKAVSTVAMQYPKPPETLRELLEMTVKLCVGDYNRRVLSRGEHTEALSREEIEERCTVGAVTFGALFGEEAADEAEAVRVALQGFEDGLYRVFRGEEELTELSQEPELAEGDTLTFVRLTMLAGRLF